MVLACRRAGAARGFVDRRAEAARGFVDHRAVAARGFVDHRAVAARGFVDMALPGRPGACCLDEWRQAECGRRAAPADAVVG